MPPEGTDTSPAEPVTQEEHGSSRNELAAGEPEIGASVLPAREPFWGYLDLMLFAGLLTASIALLLVIVALILGVKPN